MRRRFMLAAVVFLAAFGLVAGGSPAQAAVGDTYYSAVAYSSSNDSSGGFALTHTSSSTYTFDAWSYNRFGNVPTGVTVVRWVYEYSGPAQTRYIYSGSGAYAINSEQWTVPAQDANGNQLLIASVQVNDWTNPPNFGTTQIMYPVP